MNPSFVIGYLAGLATLAFTLIGVAYRMDRRDVARKRQQWQDDLHLPEEDGAE